jgi:hypothetical protein
MKNESGPLGARVVRQRIAELEGKVRMQEAALKVGVKSEDRGHCAA